MRKVIKLKNNEIYLKGQFLKTSFTVINFRISYNKNGYNKSFKLDIQFLGRKLNLEIQLFKKTIISNYCYARNSF